MFPTSSHKKEGNGAGTLLPAAQRALTRLREEFRALCDRFYTRWPAPFQPSCGLEHFWDLDVEDRDNEIVIQAEAPGFEAEDFDVQISGNLLKIRAEQKRVAGEKKGAYPEPRSGRFQRSITLPAGVDRDQVEARYHSGILEIRLAKTREAQAKHIPVKQI
jgi:HSP20 family protein